MDAQRQIWKEKPLRDWDYAFDIFTKKHITYDHNGFPNTSEDVDRWHLIRDICKYGWKPTNDPVWVQVQLDNLSVEFYNQFNT